MTTSETGIGRIIEDLAALGFQAHNFAGDNQSARYGYHLILDVDECDPAKVDDPEAIRSWLRGTSTVRDYSMGLVERIGMVAYGPPWIETFAHDDPVTDGYTAIQPIETSSITAHFSPHLRTAHVDVFSCRWFAPTIVIGHTLACFGTVHSKGRASFLPRG